MRVAVYYHNRDIRLEERSVPAVGPGEILVKVQACGVCGSDVMEWYRRKSAPRVLGHEMTGEIAKLGEDVEAFRVGDRVFVSHHVPCGACRYCREGLQTLCDTLRSTNFDPGGFSEYLRAPKINVAKGVFRLPDALSYEEGTFIEPLACAVRGQRIARIRKGQSVLVIGCGVSGLLHVALAKARGAGRVIASDLSDKRLAAAKSVGADAVMRAGMKDFSKKLCEINGGLLAQRVIVATGAPAALVQALRCADRGGVLLYYAPSVPETTLPPFPFNDFWLNGLTLTTTYGAAPDDLKEAIALLRDKRLPVTGLITHRLPLAETGRGFQLTAEGKDSLKVIIEPWA